MVEYLLIHLIKNINHKRGAIIWFGISLEGSRGAFWGIKEGKKDILWDMDIKVYVLDGVGMVTLYILYLNGEH